MSSKIERLIYVRNVIAMEQLRLNNPAHAHMTQKYLERCGLWGKNYTQNMRKAFSEEKGEINGDDVPEAMVVPTSEETLDLMFDWFEDDQPFKSPQKIRPLSKLEPMKKKDDDDKGEDDDPSN